jgi:hypothetical protein
LTALTFNAFAMDVKMPRGEIEIESPRMFWAGSFPHLQANLINRSGVGWDTVRLTLKWRCAASGESREGMILIGGHFEAGQLKIIDSAVVSTMGEIEKRCDSLLLLSADGSSSIPDREQIEQHQAELRRYPAISNGYVTIFVGADRRCSEQFAQALSIGGLELRKTTDELLKYHCGFTEMTGLRAKKLDVSAGYCRVKFLEGDHQDQEGWVPCGWLRQ